MQYELECGHCGCQFVLDVAALPRTTKCDVCGGILAIVVPVPLAPAPSAPEPPPPPASPEPAPVPAAPGGPRPGAPDPDSLHPEDRAGYLAEPWWSAYRALISARSAATFALPACILFLIFELFVTPVLKEPPLAEPSLYCFALLFSIPAVVHAAAQFTCSQVPRTHGAPTVSSSLVFHLASLVVGALAVTRRELITVVSFPALALVAFDFWLVFLVELTRRLGSARLVATAEGFSARYRGWSVAAFAAFATALVGAHAGNRVVVGAGECVAGAIMLILLREYVSLLRKVSVTVARRAPLESG